MLGFRVLGVGVRGPRAQGLKLLRGLQVRV